MALNNWLRFTIHGTTILWRSIAKEPTKQRIMINMEPQNRSIEVNWSIDMSPTGD